MIGDKKILAVVPARGGSKTVEKKNIRPLLGVPLVAYVGSLVKELTSIDRAVVSTDDTEIAAAAAAAGLEAPFSRPAELSGDLIADVPVLRHALIECERIYGARFDVVVMLQPTSPLRKAAHVNSAIHKLVNEGWDAVWTISPTDVKYHPLKQLTIDADGRLEYFDTRGRTVVARQQLGPVFHRNGGAYVLTRECLMEQQALLGKRSAAVVISDPMISIDTLADFEVAERYLKIPSGRS